MAGSGPLLRDLRAGSVTVLAGSGSQPWVTWRSAGETVSDPARPGAGCCTGSRRGRQPKIDCESPLPPCRRMRPSWMRGGGATKPWARARRREFLASRVAAVLPTRRKGPVGRSGRADPRPHRSVGRRFAQAVPEPGHACCALDQVDFGGREGQPHKSLPTRSERRSRRHRHLLLLK